MIKNYKIALIALGIVLACNLVIALPAVAQDATDDATQDETITATDLGVSEPATGFFGFLKNISNGVQYALTFNPVKKAELKLEHANDALLRAQTALENNPDSIKAQEKYYKYLEKFEKKTAEIQEKVQTFKEKADTNPAIDNFLNRLTDNTLKQQRVMDHLSGFLDDDQRTKLQEKREETIKTFGEILKNLDDKDKLPERLDNIMGEQTGSELIHLKNMEMLGALKNQLPEDYVELIKDAEDKSLHRFNQAIQNTDSAERHNRLNTYFENSGSDPLSQVELLQTLEEAPTSLSGLQALKANIPAIKNDRIEKIDNMIEAFKNDEHKIMNLERIRNIEDPQTKTLLRQIENKYVNPEAPAGTPLKVDSLKESVRAGYQENEKPIRMQEKVEGGVDKIKDVINKEEDNSLRDTIKDATGQAIEANEKPIRMQEKVEGGVDKIKDVNQNRIETQNKERLNQPDTANDSVN